jgi:peptidoglycan/LPS O-acetylase OafA/YrhL
VLTCQLFLLSRRQRSILDRVPPALLGSVAIVVLMILFAQFRYFGEHDPWYSTAHFTYGAFIVNLHQNFLFAPCCYALIFSLACGGWTLARVLSSRPALFCGDVSYSTYLSHEMVIAKLGQLGAGALATVPYLTVLLPIVYAVSWLLYSLVEMPAKRMLRTYFNSWTLRRASAEAASE